MILDRALLFFFRWELCTTLNKNNEKNDLVKDKDGSEASYFNDMLISKC